MLFWVWLYFIFLSVLDSSVSRLSNIPLYCLPDLYLSKTGLSLLTNRFFNISVDLRRGLVFHAYSNLIIY